VAKTLQDRITFLKDQIAKSVPLFADYLNLSTTLNDYSHSLQKYIPHKIHQERQVYLKEVVESEIKRIFGDSFNINNFDLGNQSVYSVVDHHDILNHQLFISPNILSNIFRFEARQRM
jgi:inorganic pyrophosphatase/exopolyphosphatase